MDLGGITRSLPLQNVFFEGSLCLIVVASLVLSTIIAIWVYRDAESRGMSGVLWLLVMLVGGLIGLLIYLIVCGATATAGAGFCRQCGAKL